MGKTPTHDQDLCPGAGDAERGPLRKSSRVSVTEAHTSRAALEALCAGTVSDDGAVISTCVHLAWRCPHCWAAVGQLEPWLPREGDRITTFSESLRVLTAPREAAVAHHYEFLKALQDAPRRWFAFVALLVENAFTLTLTEEAENLAFFDLPIAVLDILAPTHPRSIAVQRIQARCDARYGYVLAQRGETEEAAKILDRVETRVGERDAELDLAIGLARAMIFRTQGDAEHALLCYGEIFDKLPYPSFLGLEVFLEMLGLLSAMGETNFDDLLPVLRELIQAMSASADEMFHVALLAYARALSALPKGSVSETDLTFVVNELEQVRELFCEPFANGNYEWALGRLLSHIDVGLSFSHYRRAMDGFIAAGGDANLAVVTEESIKVLDEFEDADLKRELLTQTQGILVRGLARFEFDKIRNPP